MGIFDTTNHLVAGLRVFVLAGSGAAAQLVFGRSVPWMGAAAGSVALSLGTLLIVAATATDSGALYVAGAVVGGAGFGVAFLGALRALSAVIPPEHRAAVMSAFYVVAYAALSLPATLAGARHAARAAADVRALRRARRGARARRRIRGVAHAPARRGVASAR